MMYSTRENIIETHYAHGDTLSANRINEQQEDKKQDPECCPTTTTEIQPNPPSDCTAGDKKSTETKVVGCSSSIFSISQLQEDSAKLFQSNKADDDDDVLTGATIFDLCLEDRKRVATLINELASRSQSLAQLEENYYMVSTREEQYKGKCNSLYKKVDALKEKCQKYQNEKSQMKKSHVESLTNLSTKVTNISDQFENSAKESKYLRDNNALLQNENKRLGEKIISLESKLTESEKTNQQLSINLVHEKTRAKELEKKYKLIKKKQEEVEKNQHPSNNNYKNKVSSSAEPSSRKAEKDTQYDDTKFGTNSNVLLFEEEILHDLFFRF